MRIYYRILQYTYTALDHPPVVRSEFISFGAETESHLAEEACAVLALEGIGDRVPG